MTRLLRFPFHMTDDQFSDATGDARRDAHVALAKTDLAAGTPSHDEAVKLAARLGASDAASGRKHQCPQFAFLPRGSGLRAKDAHVQHFDALNDRVFHEWAYSKIKTTVVWKNDDPSRVVSVYWHTGASPDGDPRGRLAARVTPGGSSRTATYPSHAFSAYWAEAHANPDPLDFDGAAFALPAGAALLTHVATTEKDVVLRVPGSDGPRDAHVSCRRVTECAGPRIRARCPRTCDAAAYDRDARAHATAGGRRHGTEL